MQLFTLALFASAALGASLSPRGRSSSCRPLEAGSHVVATLVDDYAQLIGNFTPALSDRFVADAGFTDTSDSINALAGLPLGSTTFASKATFVANQASQAKIPLVVTSISAVTCDSIVLRWTQTFGLADLPAAGISILDFVCEGGGWKLKTLYTEFNSLVYFQDVGGSCAL